MNLFEVKGDRCLTAALFIWRVYFALAIQLNLVMAGIVIAVSRSATHTFGKQAVTEHSIA